MDRRSEELVAGYDEHEKSVPPYLRPFVAEIARLRAAMTYAAAALDEVQDELAEKSGLASTSK